MIIVISTGEALSAGGDFGIGGWTPVLALVEVGDRILQQVVDFTGGSGVKPATGLYVGEAGLVADPDDATNVRGETGVGSPGLNAWTAIEAIVVDGERRVKQVVDWVGGTGDKPAIGMYVGPAGYVALAAQATDVRGPEGDEPAESLRDKLESLVNGEKLSPSAIEGGIPSVDLPEIIGELSWRGFTNQNNGYPAFKLGGQAIAFDYTVNTSGKTIKRIKAIFMGAFAHDEQDASGGTMQMLIEYPPNSGIVHVIKFNNSNEGTIPSAWPKILESDELNFDWLPDTGAFIALSGAGVIPCVGVGDWAINSKSGNRSLFIQIANTDKAAMQVHNLTLNQIKNMRMVPQSRAIISAVWSAANGGQLTLGIPGHGLASSVGVKALVRASIGGATSINGLYASVSLAGGSHQIIVPCAVDPTNGGVTPIADFGLIEFWGMPAGFAIAVNAGVATVTHAAHGRSPGHWLTYVGFQATGWNKHWEIDTVIDANTYTFKVPASFVAPTTNGAFTNTYGVPTGTSQYGLRPYSLVGWTDTDCPFDLSNSTNTTVDIISDNSGQAGLVRRCLNGLPSISGGANNDALWRWLAGITVATPHHTIRLEAAKRYCSSFFYAPSRNDSGNWTETTWTGWRDQFWALMDVEPFKTWAAHGKNSVLLDITSNTSSSDEFSSLDNQAVWANDGGRQLFNGFLTSLMGKVFNRLFNYAGLLEPFGQPGKFKVHPRARQLVASITAGSSLIMFDDTPTSRISIEDDGLCLALRQAGNSGTDGTTFLCAIRYRSPTTAIACANVQKKLTANASATVVNGVGYLGARWLIQKNGTNSSIHDAQDAFELLARELGIKRPQK
jgi:hypothetical protein